MTHHRRLESLLVLVLATLTGCGAPTEPQSPPPSAQVQVRAAESRTFNQTLVAYGVAEPSAAAITGLSVQYEARVNAVRASSGESVHQGQPLMELAASAASQLDLDRAGRDAEQAAAEQAHVARLRSQGLATDSELRAAQNAAVTARELHESLMTGMGPNGVHVLDAPRDGIVDALTAQAGDLLAPGTVLMRIIQPDGLIVRLGVEPTDVAQVVVGQSVRIALLSGTSPVIPARVTGVDRRVDPQAHLAAAIVELPHHPALLPGVAVRGGIVLATHATAVGIPRSAVLYAGDQSYVFVADSKNVAHRRAVRIGLQDDEWLEVLDGIKIGEIVVVSGNYELADGMSIRPLPESTPESQP